MASLSVHPGVPQSQRLSAGPSPSSPRGSPDPCSPGEAPRLPLSAVQGAGPLRGRSQDISPCHRHRPGLNTTQRGWSRSQAGGSRCLLPALLPEAPVLLGCPPQPPSLTPMVQHLLILLFSLPPYKGLWSYQASGQPRVISPWPDPLGYILPPRLFAVQGDIFTPF